MKNRGSHRKKLVLFISLVFLGGCLLESSHHSSPQTEAPDVPFQLLTDIGTLTSDIAWTVKLQDDGKIIVAGDTSSGADEDLAILRYDKYGVLDSTFGTDGKFVHDVGTSSIDRVLAIALQSDGKIIAGGITDASGTRDLLLARLLSDGSLDTTFGTAGLVVDDVGTSSIDQMRDLAVQSDGKIVVTGFSDSAGTEDVLVTRYEDDGTIDTSFGASGYVLLDIGTASLDRGHSLALQDDGKIVVIGLTNSGGTYDMASVRLETDGSVDTSFGTSGYVVENLGGSENANDVKLGSSGEIYIAGSSDGAGSYDYALWKLATDGSLDTAFGTGGVAVVDLDSGTEDEGLTLAVQSDGKLLIGGYSSTIGSDDPFDNSIKYRRISGYKLCNRRCFDARLGNRQRGHRKWNLYTAQRNDHTGRLFRRR